jgi:hypothetical protein
MADDLDPRLAAARPDLAAADLEGKVAAERFVEGEECAVAIGRASLRGAPSFAAAQDSELLFGESVAVYDRKDGWAWVQAKNDGYVGYVREAALAAPFAAGARVVALMSPLFPAPDLKRPVQDFLPLNALVKILSREGSYAEIAPGRFVPVRHLAPVDSHAPDWVAVAERFLGLPYVWGGKTAAGLDCSGLVQTALAAAGRAAPRDTDLMERALGTPIDGDLKRGDLVFWKGHMGVMRDEATLLHANAWHMQVASEPLAEAMARIAEAAGPVTAMKRLVPLSSNGE